MNANRCEVDCVFFLQQKKEFDRFVYCGCVLLTTRLNLNSLCVFHKQSKTLYM
jgi:hypothetical protein